MDEQELILPTDDDHKNIELSEEDLLTLHDAEEYEHIHKGQMQKWDARALELGKRWVLNTPENAAAFAAQTTEVFQLIYQRLNTVYHSFDEDIRSQAAIHLWADIRRYDPSLSSLDKYLSHQIKLRVRGLLKRSYQNRETEQHRLIEAGIQQTIYLAQPPASDSRSIAETLSTGEDYEEAYIQHNDYVYALTAMILNFRSLLEDWSGDAREMLHYRMFYTEQITFHVQDHIPTGKYHADIFRAIYGPYLCYFAADVPHVMTMRALHTLMLKPKGEVIPGEPTDEPLNWDANGFLPVKVQCYFLRSKGICIDVEKYKSKIYNMRTKYKRRIYRKISL